MNGICFDTSGTTGSVAVIRNGQPAGSMVLSKVYGHNETLLPAIQLLMAQADLTAGELDAVGFVRGPGTFTGIRIGTAVAYGLAAAKPGIRLAGHTSLYLLARAAGPPSDRVVVPVLDARKKQVYTAAFRDDTAVTPLTVLAPDMLGDFLTAHEIDPDAIAFIGPGLTPYGDRLRRDFPHAAFLPAPKGLADTLAETLLRPGGEVPADEPLYIRKSDAEIAKESRHPKP